MSEHKKKYLQNIKINSDWIINNLIKPEWQRKLYNARINAFIKHIMNKTFRNTLITVVENNGKYILLDGQHKIEAIKRTETEQLMDVCVHEEMSEEEMKELYRILNDVKSFRLIDDLGLYIGVTEWLDALMDTSNFPINITKSGGSNSIRIDYFLNVIYNGFKTGILRNNLTRNQLDLFIEYLDAKKVSIIKDFCSFYRKCFGEPFKDNWVYKNVIMFTVMRIWLKNKDDFKQEELIERTKRIEYSGRVRQLSFIGNKEVLDEMTRKIYESMNKGFSKNKLKQFWKEKG